MQIGLREIIAVLIILPTGSYFIKALVSTMLSDCNI